MDVLTANQIVNDGIYFITRAVSIQTCQFHNSQLRQPSGRRMSGKMYVKLYYYLVKVIFPLFSLLIGVFNGTRNC